MSIGAVGARSGGHPRGFTLIEMLVTLVVMSVVLLSALSFLKGQISAYTAGNEKMARLQNYRFAANTLEKDIRVAGAGVPGNQPILVYAADDVVAFNVNYLSNTPGDPSAVYFDADATADESMALRSSNPVTMPGSTFSYPSVDYLTAGANSPAETIIFYFALDPEGEEDEERYILYRQVNGGSPEIVARNLFRNGSRPFFSYYRHSAGDPPTLDSIGGLPLMHDVPFHGSASDTASTGSPHIDEIRGIRLSYLASAVGPGGERQSVISRIVHLPDLGTVSARTCGASPLMKDDPTVAVNAVTDSDGNVTGYTATVRWEPSPDETGGEKDVSRYVIWRRPAGSTDWDEPIESVRATGLTEYYIVDANVIPGEVVEYGVAAQDCTPNLSPIARSSHVTIPALP